jgi:hypothetical protein
MPQPFGPDNPAPPRWRTPEELAARKAARDQDAAVAWDRLVGLMNSPNEPTVLASTQAVLGRVEGQITARTQLSGPDGGPIETRELSPLEAARRIAFVLTAATLGDTAQ